MTVRLKYLIIFPYIRNKKMTSEQQYIDLFREQRSLIEANSCALMNGRRQAAFEDFCRLGFPTRREERYKYTDVAQAFAPDYGLNLRQAAPAPQVLARFRCNLPNLSPLVFYVANDTFSGGAVRELPRGLHVLSMRQAAGQLPADVCAHYGRLADTAGDGLTALNTMLAQDGVVVYVEAGTVLPDPIQIINLSEAQADLMSNRRVLVVAEGGASVKLLFCDHADNRRRYLTNQVVEVVAGREAAVEIYSVEETTEQNTRFSNLYVEQQADSRVTLCSVSLHNGLTRNRTDVRLAGSHASLQAYGAVIADKQQHVDHNILVDHAVESCHSDLLYKYVLNDRAVGAFAGKVLVRPGAQHTDSQQTNANLCASPEAHMYTQPMLEIYADDVKCNHGSTVGRFDEQALFYMCQRGIPEAEARLLLQHAFVNEVLSRIELEPLRERLAHLVEMRFRGELSKCEGCRMCQHG